MTHHAYPAQLASFVQARLDELGILPLGLSPNDPNHNADLILSALSVGFLASLLRDEGRPLTFRIAVAPDSTFASDEGPPRGVHRLCFAKPRAFTIQELKKLVSAVKFSRSLVAVYPTAQSTEAPLEIWGILHTGPRWLQVVRGGRLSSPELPPVLIVHVSGPGNLIVSVGGTILARLYAGELTIPMLDVFQSHWLPAMFADSRAEVQALHEAERRAANRHWLRTDIDVVLRIGQGFIRRMISTIRAARHGGSLLIVPPNRVADVCKEGLVDLKYRFKEGAGQKRFRHLVLDALRHLADTGVDLDAISDDAPASAPANVVGWLDYESSQSAAIVEVDEGIMELAQLIAALADVDGFVVMNQRLDIIGFGGIVSGRLPEAPELRQALDVEGTTTVEESIDEMGTRHRAAYRICAAMPDALCIVVSQDGGVRFVRWHEGAVTYWDQVAGAIEA